MSDHLCKTILGFVSSWGSISVRDFPTDPTEAASLLSEIETTHFLTISPASMPTLPPAHPPATHSPVMRPYRRPPIAPCAPLSRRLSSTSSTGSGSEPTSALSSRSSSFSHASSSAVSTPATSVASLQSLIGPSKLGLEVIYDSDDEVEGEEPTYLELAGVRHRHMDVKGPAPEEFFLRLSEAASFIRRALEGDGRGDDDSDSDGYSSSGSGSGSDSDSVGLGFVGNVGNDGTSPLKKRHVLIHCKTESRACLAVCAYLMSARRMSPSEAYGLLEKGTLSVVFFISRVLVLTGLDHRDSTPAVQRDADVCRPARAVPRVRVPADGGPPKYKCVDCEREPGGDVERCGACLWVWVGVGVGGLKWWCCSAACEP